MADLPVGRNIANELAPRWSIVPWGGSGGWCVARDRLGLLDSLDERLNGGLGIAEQHRGLLVAEQRVRNPGEAGAAPALEDDDVGRVVDVEDGHAGDG